MLSYMVMIFSGETMFEMGSNAGKPLIVTIQHFYTENKMYLCYDKQNASCKRNTSPKDKERMID